MRKFSAFLLLVFALATTSASAQIRRGTGLLNHNHGPVLFYARTVTISVKPAHREAFLQATSALQAKGAQEAGCLLYHYYEDPVTPNNFLLLTEWRSAAVQEAYYRQSYVTAYFEQLAGWVSEPVVIRMLETVNQHIITIPAKPL